jgi:CRP/FNR family transcriptional regulator
VRRNDNIIDLTSVKIACQNCSLIKLCLPLGLDSSDLNSLDHIIVRRRPIPRGEHVYRAGEPFCSLYAIRSGSIKIYTLAEDGQEQIVGFYISGELVGLDALETGCHAFSACVLETTTLCEMPFDRLTELSNTLPSLNQQLCRLMSREISHEQAMLLLLGKKSAEERLASFLLNLRERLRQRGFSGKEFSLSMSRHDIANYLGLAVETVSRLFTRFQEEGLLTVRRRQISIRDVRRLRQLVSLQECYVPPRQCF